MNRIDFQQTGGFPLETETLDEMQNAYSLLQAFGELFGAQSIVSGCNLLGTTVTDGVVYWNGELFAFKGGFAQTKVIMVEEVASVPFQDGFNKNVYKNRYVTFGSGIGETLWANFTRPLNVSTITQRLITAETKLATIAQGAQVNVQADYAQTNSGAADFIKNKPALNNYLMKGTVSIADIYGDQDKLVSFPNVGTSNYMVVGSLVSLSADYNDDNDVLWMVKSKTATSFRLLLREVSSKEQNLQFNYALIPL